MLVTWIIRSGGLSNFYDIVQLEPDRLIFLQDLVVAFNLPSYIIVYNVMLWYIWSWFWCFMLCNFLLRILSLIDTHFTEKKQLFNKSKNFKSSKYERSFKKPKNGDNLEKLQNGET